MLHIRIKICGDEFDAHGPDKDVSRAATAFFEMVYTAHGWSWPVISSPVAAPGESHPGSSLTPAPFAPPESS